MGNINESLKSFYEKTFGPVARFGNDARLYSPMLLKFDDDNAVEAADLRVMFFGQELGQGGDKDVTDMVDICMEDYRLFYRDFNKSIEIPDCWQQAKTPFWLVIAQLRDKIDGSLPSGKRSAYIWNNIVKTGDSQAKDASKRVPQNIYEGFREKNTKLILGEIEIIKPDVLVFFTGIGSPKYYYDKKIDDTFNNGKSLYKKEIDIDGNDQILAITSLPNYGDAYISYHPQALQQRPNAKGFVISAIVKQCAARIR